MHDVETIFHISYVLKHLEIFSEIRVMPLKLQIAVSRASLIFQKRFPEAVNTEGTPYVASTACTRSHIATAKQKIIISKIRKKYPLKSSYVAPRAVVGFIFLQNCQHETY